MAYKIEIVGEIKELRIKILKIGWNEFVSIKILWVIIIFKNVTARLDSRYPAFVLWIRLIIIRLGDDLIKDTVFLFYFFSTKSLNHLPLYLIRLPLFFIFIIQILSILITLNNISIFVRPFVALSWGIRTDKLLLQLKDIPIESWLFDLHVVLLTVYVLNNF